ncbi:MAG TPA: hypothetical protein PK858_11940, partial [Saprospiraceae bacterium]|nr:hypothetical protein [Saprospiraceae bacterium]
RNQAPDLKTAANTYVILAGVREQTLEKLSKTPALVQAYRMAVVNYNTTLREVFAEKWDINRVQFKTYADVEKLREDGADYPTTYVIATNDAEEMIADAAQWALKKKANSIDLDKFLLSRDEQGSIDVFNLSQWKQYWTSRRDWALKQAEKMKLDKKLGKNQQAADYLKHRVLSLTGFYLSQHALLTRSDLKFGLHYLHADLTAAALNPRKVLVNQPVLVQGADLSKKTLLIGQDLVLFPNGKQALGEKEIAAAYPHPFKIVAQSEIEAAMRESKPDVAIIIPATRWSVSGYPELQVFYVVDASNGRTVLTYADTGSGSNAMTANQFERSTELKAKHFQEISSNAEK